MSSPKTLIINCGASHVTATVFGQKGDALILEEIATQKLDYDYSVDDQWLGALLDAVGQLTAEYRVKGEATVIFPGYQLLTKNIKVPHVDPSRQQQIIAFEAQQNIPYPLDEVEWDHQVISDDGVETEVTLIAVKKDIAERFCQGMTAKGVVPIAVQASSILDFNAYRYVYEGDEEPTLFINIGARSSNLIFISDEGFFVRTIPLGGNSLTQSIADNLGKSFQQAESIKVAFFTGQTSFTSDDSSVQILQSNAESFLKRMSQEITRSIVTFRRQKRGKAPARILLTGRGSLLPGLPEYLSEQQKMAVDYFDPTRRLELGTSVDAGLIQREQYNLSELIGVASQSLIADAVGINLLPERIEAEREFSKKKPFLLTAAVLLVLAGIPPLLYFQQAESAYRTQAQKYQAPATTLEQRSAEIEELNEQALAIKANIDALYDLRASKNNWINFLADMMQRLQAEQDVWLTELKVNREGAQPRNNNANSGGFTVAASARLGDEPLAGIQYQLDLAGVLLLREYDPENPEAFSSVEAAEKVNQLIESFTQSEFVSSVDNTSFDFTNKRLLRFKFSLMVNPDKPL